MLRSENYIGRAPEQVDDFVRDVVATIKRRFKKYADVGDVELRV